MSQRESLLDSLQVGKSDSSDLERFRRRVEHWKELALGFLPEVYALRTAIDSINKGYFDGQQTLFPTVVEGFEQLLALAEKTDDIHNDALAGEIERLESLLHETGDRQDHSPLAINLAGLIDNVQGSAKGCCLLGGYGHGRGPGNTWRESSSVRVGGSSRLSCPHYFASGYNVDTTGCWLNLAATVSN